jgi:hypothetical protein
MWIQPIHQSSIAIENGEEVTLERQGVTGFMNCLKKSVMLVGDLAAIFTTRRREQVLIKLTPSLASLGKEEFPESGKQLIRDGFQALLKARSETARTVAAAHSAGKVFFSEICLSGRARPPSRQFYTEPAQTIFPRFQRTRFTFNRYPIARFQHPRFPTAAPSQY